MNGLKSLFACALIASVATVWAAARAQSPAENLSPKSDKPPAERSVLTGASQNTKPENAPTDFCQCVGEDDSPAVARIESALRAPLHSSGIDYADVPLQEIVDQLQGEYSIPIKLNKPALEEAGIGSDSPVTIQLHNISLRSALRLTLKPLGLTYVIQNEVLLITTREDAEADLKICVYDARKIIDDPNGKNVESLVETIQSCVASDTWAENGGGNAEIRPLPSGLIVVSQTQAAHQEIRDLLTTLRKMR